MATKNELLAANKSIEDIQNFVKADSLGYLSIEGLMQSVPKPKNKYCDACFTGDYPIALSDRDGGSLPTQLSLLTENSS